MNVHQNARLTPSGRALLAERVERSWPQPRLEGVAAQGKRPLAAASRDRRIAPPPLRERLQCSSAIITRISASVSAMLS